jgi:hypothetical protein
LKKGIVTWSADHYKAIALYAKRNELRMSLSVYPKANFVDKNGKQITKDIMDLMLEYRTNKLEEDRERRRKKQEEENQKPWTERRKLK